MRPKNSVSAYNKDTEVIRENSTEEEKMTKAEQIKGKFTFSITFLELSGRLLTRRRNSLTSETKSKIYNKFCYSCYKNLVFINIL